MTIDALPWVPAITTSGLLAVAVWIGKKLLLTRLKAGVTFEFDKKLETIRSELREKEEKLKADLKRKDDEIRLLRESAISASFGRRHEIEKRKLEAIDQIWSAINELAPVRTICHFMGSINFEEACNVSPHPGVQKMMQVIGVEFDVKKLGNSAIKARPFVSPWIWAIYSTFLAINMTALMRWQVLLNGLSEPGLIKHDKVDELIKIALPHYSKLIDDHGYSCHHLLLEDLENLLVKELQNSIDGLEVDQANVGKAAAILKLSNEAMDQMNSSANSA